MKKSLSRRSAAALTGLAITAIAANAAADPDCKTLPKPLYITGSTAVQPLLKALGAGLAGTTTIVYKGQGSCLGVDAIINGTKVNGTATYWDAQGNPLTCNLDAAGDAADIGVSDVFATTCPGFDMVPADVGDFFGPNQVMNFVVPHASSQTLISAEAAYFVYGFGAAGQAEPWTDETFIFQRSATSGTQAMIATAITVPPAKWKGTQEAKSGDMLAAVSGSKQPEKTIGILASDVADANRKDVTILAYQHFKQDCAWLPDSSSTSFDKINVRDGHYPIWGPIHMLAKVDASKKPVSAAVATFVGYFAGTSDLPAGVDLLTTEVKAHTVPACAMRVQRSAEVGDVSAVTPVKSCGCAFEFIADGSVPASCKTCSKDADCSGDTKHCNYGYCEAN
jgi:ABC-type phosphate transport system substrate-binding protein